MTDDLVPDETDIAILNALQGDFPLVPHPWKEIAERAGIPEQVLLGRLERLRDAGILRGISPILESREWGLPAATLVALHIPPERVQEVAVLVSSYPEVSHNFRRDHHYPLWFTLSGRDERHIRDLLSEILRRTGVAEGDVLNLPTVRRLKVDVRFSFLGKTGEEGCNG